MTVYTGAVGAFKTATPIVDRRKNMKYKINTSSTTGSGVVPIRGVNKYPEEPSIYFTREAWIKQCHLVDKCLQEVGWFALVDHDERDNSFTITEIVIPKQEVTAAETDIGKEDLADAAMELIAQGKDTGKMYAWFHSHVNMGVSPSAQDEYQVEDFLEDLADQPEVPAFIRGIQNKKGDLKLDVYYIQHGIAYQNVEFYVLHDDDPQWTKDIDAEIKAKVSERVTQYYNYAGAGGNRPYAGKDKSGVAKGNEGWRQSDAFQRGYGNWQDGIYDEYDNDYNDDDLVPGIVAQYAADDIPLLPAPIPSALADDAYLTMEVVYQATADNCEVMLDLEGKLWICDEKGDMYDYQEYTEAYGEIAQ